MLDFTCPLPDQHNIYPVVHADGQHKTEREHIEQIEIDAQQFHRSDHCSDTEGECDDLDEPQTKIPVQKGQQRYAEDRHSRANYAELMLRPWLWTGERGPPARAKHGQPGTRPIASRLV